MSKAFEKVRTFIEHHSMLSGSRGVLVAVSGGADSIALLDMLVRLVAGARGQGSGASMECADTALGVENLMTKSDAAGPFASRPDPRSQTPGPYLHVAHLDHMLRGGESEQDAEFVRARAEELRLPVTIGRADVRAAAAASRRGVEEVAREIRYEFLLTTARAVGCDRIATGHTMNDQAETFLMRLARGAGLRGLAAMRPISPTHTFVGQGSGARGQGPAINGMIQREPHVRNQQYSDGSNLLPRPLTPAPRPLIIRPLLCITRDEVEEYCHERNLKFRTDLTNSIEDYTRNYIRLSVLPALCQINPRIVERVARTAEIIANDQDALDALTSSLVDQARQQSVGEASAYSVAAFLKQPIGLRRRMIIEAIKRARAGVLPAGNRARPSSDQVDLKHVTAVERLLEEKTSGSRIDLPQGLEVWREFDRLVIGRDRSVEESGYEQEISGATARVKAGGLEVLFERNRPGHLLKPSIEKARREKEDRGRDWMIAVLDDLLMPDYLVIRPRRAGERAHVLGQRKTKKLKKLMIDHKIPSSRRAIWPVVATPDGRYVWSPGLPPAFEFAARDETHGLAILRASGI